MQLNRKKTNGAVHWSRRTSRPTFLTLVLSVSATVLLSSGFIRSAAGQDVLQQSQKIPALGRPFALGALYDVRKDKLVAPGITLWDKAFLEQHVQERISPYTKANLLQHASWSERVDLFKLDGHMKANFAAGLIRASGSGSYMMHTVKDDHTAQVAYQLSKTTHVRELSMEHAGNIQYPNVFDDHPEATHIVTRIVYGANVVISFEKTVKKRDTVRKISGKMAAEIELIAIKAQSSLGVVLNEERKKFVEDIDWNIFGDFDMQTTPRNITDVIKLYNRVPKLITRDTAVPMEVYLLPLDKLDSTAKRLVRRISVSILKEIENRMNNYEELVRKTNDLLYHNRQVRHFKRLSDSIKDFRSGLDSHQNVYRRQLLAVLPKVRGRGLEEIELTKILDESKTSLTMRALENWLDWKSREAGALEPTFKYGLNKTLLKTPGELTSLLTNPGLEHLIVLSVTLPDVDIFLNCLKRLCTDPNVIYSSWVAGSRYTSQVRKSLGIFKDLHEISEYDKVINSKYLPGDEKEPVPHYAISEKLKAQASVPEIKTELIYLDEGELSVELDDSMMPRLDSFEFAGFDCDSVDTFMKLKYRYEMPTDRQLLWCQEDDCSNQESFDIFFSTEVPPPIDTPIMLPGPPAPRGAPGSPGGARGAPSHRSISVSWSSWAPVGVAPTTSKIKKPTRSSVFYNTRGIKSGFIRGTSKRRGRRPLSNRQKRSVVPFFSSSQQQQQKNSVMKEVNILRVKRNVFGRGTGRGRSGRRGRRPKPKTPAPQSSNNNAPPPSSPSDMYSSMNTFALPAPGFADNQGALDSAAEQLKYDDTKPVWDFTEMQRDFPFLWPVPEDGVAILFGRCVFGHCGRRMYMNLTKAAEDHEMPKGCQSPCQYTPWSAWGACSIPCKNTRSFLSGTLTLESSGRKTRTRKVSVPPSNGAPSCDQPLLQANPCGTELCRKNCVWGAWGAWSGCSGRCGPSAKQTRRRAVTQPAVSGGSCPGSPAETKRCGSLHCPVNCRTSGYLGWKTNKQKFVKTGWKLFHHYMLVSRNPKIVQIAMYGGRPCSTVPQKKEIRACHQDFRYCKTRSCRKKHYRYLTACSPGNQKAYNAPVSVHIPGHEDLYWCSHYKSKSRKNRHCGGSYPSPA